MHVAVASSLAVIVVTSLVSARSHARRDGVDMRVARQWALPVAVGALAGGLAARVVPGDALRLLFGLLALLVGIRLISGAGNPDASLRLTATARRAAAGAIGLLSAWLGIGGGTFAVPVLHGVGLPMHRAVGTSALLGFFVATPAALGFAIGGAGIAGRLPASIGYLHMPSVLALALGAVLVVPLGARLAHALPQARLRQVFGLFLLVAAARMMLKALG
jgi:uncharacterized membrane protein YfcA